MTCEGILNTVCLLTCSVKQWASSTEHRTGFNRVTFHNKNIDHETFYTLSTQADHSDTKSEMNVSWGYVGLFFLAFHVIRATVAVNRSGKRS